MRQRLDGDKQWRCCILNTTPDCNAVVTEKIYGITKKTNWTFKICLQENMIKKMFTFENS